MKTRLKPLAVGLCLAGMVATPAFAATGSDNTQIKKLELALNNLQTEVTSLKSQLKVKHLAVNTSQAYSYQDTSTNATTHKHRHTRVAATTTTDDATSTPDVGNPAHMTGRDILRLVSEQKEYMPFDLDVPGQAFVSTGPYIGVPITFSGSNLIINSPSVNTDLQLLGIRKKIINQLNVLGGLYKEPEHSHLLFSGVIESQAGYLNHSGQNNGGLPSTFIDVDNISIDATIFGPSDWLLGFIELSYDNGPPPGSSYIVSNSRVFVNKAFVTIGDLVKSPFYGTFGQFYVPFGRYSSVMISDPLTKLLTRTKARAILVGVQTQGENSFYGATYIFKGDSHAPAVTKVNNGGINLGGKFKYGWFGADIAGGVIANIADSGGLQVGNNFQAFEQLAHRVPGYNLHGVLSLGEHVDIIGEFVSATKRFSPVDMGYNGHGAKPSAYDIEGSYSFNVFDLPSSVGLGYSKSNQAMAIGIPLTRTYFVVNTSIWRNTLQGIEFRHDREYAASDTGVNANNVAAPAQTGKSDNAVTANFDFFF